jgi:CheY-specific phosphatase CheX
MSENDILQQIDNLLSFTELLPENSRNDYKNRLSKVRADLSENFAVARPILKPGNPVLTKEILVPGGKQPKKNISLINLTKLLVPRLTEKGNNILDEISTPVSVYQSLMMINEKSSILEIYYAEEHQYSNYLEFLNVLNTLYENDYISFIKTAKIPDNKGWIMLGRILEDCIIIEAENIEKAITYQEDKKVRYFGEALTALKFTNTALLEQALKIQKWLSEIAVNSPFIKANNRPENYLPLSFENISENETKFIISMREIMEENFNVTVKLGKFKNISLKEPLNENMIIVVTNVTGNLNGIIYYIFDKTFFETMTRNIMVNFLPGTANLDQRIISEISELITVNCQTRLARQGIFCKTSAPEVFSVKSQLTGDNIKALTMMNRSGRFINGFSLKD